MNMKESKHGVFMACIVIPVFIGCNNHGAPMDNSTPAPNPTIELHLGENKMMSLDKLQINQAL